MVEVCSLSGAVAADVPPPPKPIKEELPPASKQLAFKAEARVRFCLRPLLSDTNARPEKRNCEVRTFSSMPFNHTISTSRIVVQACKLCNMNRVQQVYLRS